MRGNGTQRVCKNVSLRAVDLDALLMLMEDEGALVLSSVVRELIREGMTRRYGPRWETAARERRANGNGNGKDAD